jgi:4-coumarate--CoA ligase
LKDSGAQILFTSHQGINVALKAAAGASLAPSRVFVFGDPCENLENLSAQPWTKIWSSLEDAQSWQWSRLKTLKEANETTAVINYSSGTTGLPKGVEITHYNLVANSEQVLYKRDRFSGSSCSQKRKENVENSGERWLAPLPMYHAYGQTYSCLSAARLGAKVFIMPQFTLDKYLQFLDIYRITFMTTVPTILTMLHKYEYPEKFNLKSVEVVTSGSAPLDSNLAASITEKYLRRGVIVKQGWGMTETTCSVTGFSPDDEDEGKSIGWLNPNCAAKIVPLEDDETDTTTSHSSATTGELLVAGPQMMKGYWKNVKATNETVVESDGLRWIRTGDIAYFDDRGCIYIVDRLKVMVTFC